MLEKSPMCPYTWPRRLEITSRGGGNPSVGLLTGATCAAADTADRVVLRCQHALLHYGHRIDRLTFHSVHCALDLILVLVAVVADRTAANETSASTNGSASTEAK